VDFIVEDENMLEVAQWIVENTTFDRLYYYGADRPIHVSFSETPVSQITLMIQSSSERQVPKTISLEQFKNIKGLTDAPKTGLQLRGDQSFNSTST
jgi:hypothetical protein